MGAGAGKNGGKAANFCEYSKKLDFYLFILFGCNYCGIYCAFQNMAKRNLLLILLLHVLQSILKKDTNIRLF